MSATLSMALLAFGCGGDPEPRPGFEPLAPPATPPEPSDTPAQEPPSGRGSLIADRPARAMKVPYPDPDWPTGEPEAHGLDAAGLELAADVASQNGSHCLLVIRHGTLVGEWYWGESDVDTPHKTWSLAKSYAAVLVGIAIENGELSGLDEPVAEHLPEWQGTAHEPITLRHLLTMTSGLSWSAFDDYVTMAVFAQDHTAHALGLDLETSPGSEWIYHNGGVQVLDAVFRNATGMTVEEYAEAHLWSRIGMRASWAHDPAGNPTVYASVLASCRDHARLGYLYLHGGAWQGQPIVSPAFVQTSLTPSQPFNHAYGLLWWLNAEVPAVDAMMNPWPGRMVPFAPPDLFAARGFGNQFIDVVPSLDLVVVRMGTDPFSSFDLAQLMLDQRFEKHDAILAPVLDAIVD